MIFEETPYQRDVANYSVVLQLKSFGYTNNDIAESLGYSLEQLQELINKFTLEE